MDRDDLRQIVERVAGKREHEGEVQRQADLTADVAELLAGRVHPSHTSASSDVDADMRQYRQMRRAREQHRGE